MKLLRTSMMALAALIVAGTVASAAPWYDEVVDPDPTVSPSPTVEPTVSPSPEAEPVVEAEEGDPTGEGKTPDFSECKEEGYTGLANAICRHEALLQVKRDHQGLMNALEHLYANQQRKAERWAEKHGEGAGTTTEGDTSCPGKSCEPHGNGNGHSSH